VFSWSFFPSSFVSFILFLFNFLFLLLLFSWSFFPSSFVFYSLPPKLFLFLLIFHVPCIIIPRFLLYLIVFISSYPSPLPPVSWPSHVGVAVNSLQNFTNCSEKCFSTGGLQVMHRVREFSRSFSVAHRLFFSLGFPRLSFIVIAARKIAVLL
jgi:hypothetical protein